MLRALAHWFRRLTTSRDNQTPDVIRIGGVLIGVQFLLHSGFDLVVLNNAFDPTNYGTGAAAILASIGAALGFKRRDEPEPQ